MRLAHKWMRDKHNVEPELVIREGELAEFLAKRAKAEAEAQASEAPEVVEADEVVEAVEVAAKPVAKKAAPKKPVAKKAVADDTTSPTEEA